MRRAGEWRGSKPLNRLTILGFVTVLVIAGVSPRPASGQTLSSSGSAGSAGYSSTSSWALGVVVPNGVQLAGGGKLSWGGVSNVTVQVTLPQINRTDGAVLAILSLMTRDGHVLQLAAGIYPETQRWLSYAWLITNIQATSQNYEWVVNSSAPEMSPGSVVALSVFLSAGVWNYQLRDVSSHQSTQGEFPSGESSPPAAGDQEVFAMESYSENGTVFSSMGNLTLTSLTIDGENVVQGLYFYSNWEGQGNPLFIVGGYTEPPPFISIQNSGNGTVVWSYTGAWTGQPPSLNLPVSVVAIAILGACIVAAAIVFVRVRGTGHRQTRVEDQKSVRNDALPEACYRREFFAGRLTGLTMVPALCGLSECFSSVIRIMNILIASSTISALLL